MPQKQRPLSESTPALANQPRGPLASNSNAELVESLRQSGEMDEVEAFNFLESAENAQRTEEPRSEIPLRVVSYNIQGGCSAPMDEGVYNLEATLDVIRRTRADVVTLQEVSAGGRKGSCKITENQFKEIPARLGMKGHRQGTLLTLVRPEFSITSKGGGAFKAQDGEGGARRYARTEIQTEDGAGFAVYNAHTERFDPGVREKQIRQLEQRASGDELPSVVAGDFNECGGYVPELFDENFETGLSEEPSFTPAEPESEKTRKLLRDSSGCPSSGSVQERIDYIFGRKDGFEAGEGSVLRDAGPVSDHYPIQQEFTFRRPAARP